MSLPLPDICRKVLSLLAVRCEAYHDWEVAFRSVLIAVKNPTAASTFFQQTNAGVAQKISSVSLSLRNEVLPQITASSSPTAKSEKLLANLIETIQKNEKTKFETTVAMQKMIMNHMRGENCGDFVHSLSCAVYNFCFSFIGGSSLAKVTASASVLSRRRLDEKESASDKEKSAAIKKPAQIDVTSSDDDNKEEVNEENKEASSKKELQEDECDKVSKILLEFLVKIKDAEENISDSTSEIQAMVSDGE